MTEEQNILIVEDDVDLAEMLSAYFRVQGYQVRLAGWGEDALRMARESAPDVVVLDIRLPDIDGYEVCRQLRRSRHTQSVPVIFLTEQRGREDRLAGLELGAVDYITKPFDIQELRLRVRNSLRRAQQHPLVNPVTGLPEGDLVRERLEKMLTQEKWGLVVAGIHGLGRFRDQYGFVAADDVVRAISLMITNAMQDSGAAADFVGHLDNVEFIIVTQADRCQRLADSCLARLQPSIQYFYPAVERQGLPDWPDSERLTVHVTSLTAGDGDHQGFESLREALGGLAG